MSEGERTIEKFSLYVQCYMNTYIILLADPGLHTHKQHDVLNGLVSLAGLVGTVLYRV